jgi:hypothetical protein
MRVTLFQNEKVSREHPNAKASTFSSQLLEGEGDDLVKRKSFKGAPEY